MKSISCLFYVVFFILSSCTITKRHFGNGYHVEWKKHRSKTERSVVADEPGRADTLYAQTTPVPQPDIEKNIPEHGNEVLAEEAMVPVPEAQTPNESQDELISKDETVRGEVNVISPSRDYPDDYETRKRVEPLTWIAFSVFLLAIAMFLIPLQFAVANASVLGLIFALLIIGAAVTALVSWLHIKKNPSRYKGKTFTGIVLFFCSAGVGLAVLSLIGFLRNLF